MKSKIIDLEKDRFDEVIEKWIDLFTNGVNHGNTHMEFNGLCHALMWMNQFDIISHFEFSDLNDFIHENKPKDIDEEYFKYSGFWYKSYSKEKRLKWLNDQLLKNI